MSRWLWPQPEGMLVRLRPLATSDEPALIEMATDPRVRRYIGGPIDESIATAKAYRKVTAPAWATLSNASAPVPGAASNRCASWSFALSDSR